MTNAQVDHVWECLDDNDLVRCEIFTLHWSHDRTRETPPDPTWIQVTTWCRFSPTDKWGPSAVMVECHPDNLRMCDIRRETIETMRMMASVRRMAGYRALMAEREQLAELMLV